MGFLKDLVGVAAPIVGGVLGGPAGSALGGLLGGAVSGSGQPKSTTATQQQKLDPRMDAMLFGANGQTGLLDQYKGMLNTPRSTAAADFAQANSNYLIGNGASDMGNIRNAALGVMGGNSAPTSSTATGAGLNAYAAGNMVQAPSQNNMDLSGAYDRFINGTPGANQFLDQSINGAIAQNRLGFQQLQEDATKNLMQNVMPSIRGNSVLAGQYGGSRQGIAEGSAIGTLGTEMARAASQFGQNATNAAVNAKAGAYETDSNRALAATQGLGAQQYGVAAQNAQTKNQAEFMNVGNTYDLGKFNAGQAQQNNQFNAGMQLNTNAQNNSAALAGGGLLSGLLGQASSTVNANDNWSLDRASQVNGLLAPYMGANQSSSNTQPLYSNTMGNALGGLAMGAQLGGLFGQNLSLPSLQTNYASPITALAQPQKMPINLPFMSNI